MEAKEVHAWLCRNGTRRTVAGMARFGIVARQACGVTMAQLLGLKKRIGRDHALAIALWDSGWSRRACWPRWWVSPSGSRGGR